MNINDIAKLAEVGVGTVSRVINNQPGVKDETREKVMDVIRENNYVPNSSARNLKRVKSNTIGVFVRGVFNPFFSEMIDIISKVITENGYSMILRHSDYANGESGEIMSLLSFQKEIKLRGIIYLGCNIREIDEDTFKDISVPLVLASSNWTHNKNIRNFSSIGIKQGEAALKGIKYLINNGHKNIAIIMGAKDYDGVGIERLLGYKEALKESKMLLREEYIVYGEYTAKGAYEETRKLIKNNKEIDGIFCISDIMATGCVRGLIDEGIKVGKEVSVLGFDGMDIAEFYNPSITTISQPRKEMAEKSINTLMDLIKEKDEHKHILLDTDLIIRESCIKK